MARLLHRLRPGGKRHRIERTAILTNLAARFPERGYFAARLDNRNTIIYVHVMSKTGRGLQCPLQKTGFIAVCKMNQFAKTSGNGGIRSYRGYAA